MAVLPILETPDPKLREISAPLETIDDGVRTLICAMFETMYDAPGIGLAAIQVGVASRVLVIDLQEDETKHPRVFINPELSEPSEELRSYTEGCLSIPDQYAEVVRPASIRATWLDEHGGRHDERIDGLLATCLQHEVDHLNGVLFTDHLSRMKRDMVMKKLEKARRLRRAA